MIALIIVALIGFVVSTTLHILMSFQIYSPPREVNILINLGAGLLIYSAIIISKQVCAQNKIKDFRKVMLDICPIFSGLTGLLIMYTFVGFVYFLLKKILGTRP